ncbi:MAG: hypothetical protein GY810_23425 [Aureispira sp.]|nr:hypothetical protein [Aureispira sp.]
MGGSANGLEAHSTILYSIDGGVSWNVVQNNLANCLHTFAGTCNDWHRRSFALPSDADNQPDLRIAFRWTEDGNTNNNTQDYALGASFNVDNVMLSSCAKPNADFDANSTVVCKNQGIVLRTDIIPTPGVYKNCLSTLVDNCPVIGYSWNIPGATFINGTTAADKNPQITFAANGTYTLELTVSSCGGDSVITKTNYIAVSDCPPVADFMADNLNPCFEPVGKLDTVSFTDLSVTPFAPITAWNWTFSPATVTFVNGTTAASQNPQVTFDAAGSYQVSLQTTSAEGSDTETKIAYFEVISCECGSGGGGPVIIWSEDFDGNGGAGSNWDILNETIGTQGDIPSH